MTEALAVAPLATPPDATVVVPGSKSLTIRAVLAAALADGPSEIRGALASEDTDAVVDAVRRLGFAVDERGDCLTVVGQGGAIPAREATLDLVRSAASTRLLLSVVALGSGRYVLDGHPQLRSRPMSPGLDALRALGVDVEELGPPGALPVAISGGPLPGGRVATRMDTSSQFASGLLIAGPCTAAGIEIEPVGTVVSEPYLELTRSVMRSFGATVDGFHAPAGGYRATTYTVEPDASSASYFFAAAAVTGGRVRVEGLDATSAQGDLAFVDVLERMGARVERGVGFTEVEGPDELHGVDADLRHLSDTAPTFAVVAALASSPSRATGIGFIRRKETDRIGNVVNELRRCGVPADEEPDGFAIRPAGRSGLRPADVETYGDHRMAMSFAVLGLVAPGLRILDPACVAKTFPRFWLVLDSLRVRPR